MLNKSGAIELASYATDGDRREIDDMTDDDVEDLAALLPRHDGPSRRVVADSFAVDHGPQYRRTVSARKTALSVVGAIGVMLLAFLVLSNKESNEAQAEPSTNIVDGDVIPYTCPSTVQKSTNDNTGDNFEFYLRDDKKLNKTLSNFRSMPLDGWGISFNSVKKMLRPWKEEVFVPNVKSGDSIYESACGIGANLLLSTEILHEHNISNVTIYGNDYVSQSIDIANRIWSEQDASGIANKGRFCQGDSSNLDFVPSASFDLVYTGYIDPIVDPLNMFPANLTSQDKWGLSVKLCRSPKPENKELVAGAQVVQEEWFNSWVKELIRIAKPGKVIVIENGAESVCTNQRDWGGVDKPWWSEAVSKYDWEVDPDSIVIRDEKAVRGWNDVRYHVMMRKK